MNIKDAVVAALKEMVLPELAVMKQEQSEIKATLVLTNKRLDDINLHLVDQSRRIDALRQELNARIDDTNKRIDDTNMRLDRLYEVIVRREEHEKLDGRVQQLERDVQEIKRRLAA